MATFCKCMNKRLSTVLRIRSAIVSWPRKVLLFVSSPIWMSICYSLMVFTPFSRRKTCSGSLQTTRVCKDVSKMVFTLTWHPFPVLLRLMQLLVQKWWFVKMKSFQLSTRTAPCTANTVMVQGSTPRPIRVKSESRRETLLLTASRLELKVISKTLLTQELKTV